MPNSATTDAEKMHQRGEPCDLDSQQSMTTIRNAEGILVTRGFAIPAPDAVARFRASDGSLEALQEMQRQCIPYPRLPRVPPAHGYDRTIANCDNSPIYVRLQEEQNKKRGLVKLVQHPIRIVPAEEAEEAISLGSGDEDEDNKDKNDETATSDVAQRRTWLEWIWRVFCAIFGAELF